MTQILFCRNSKFLNTREYNVLGIKLATKVMRLHKTQVDKIS